ncbi:hypothetical protein EZ456_04350 [Pedobacter psychrodurus]|uniref:Methylamine utilisation protein MauE domain-containing protein n=1 Tax=Pedobacter psychrodurus TaxID=2530456 RepID=A0A4R0Q0X6_9SPHI|nr:MauE/DoxX family redox-associated membrane protein [Pedobacter psychrodurus]TCD28626.1 hypothetical protein EZ456_04350 [Pedobacter psychrodurus]
METTSKRQSNLFSSIKFPELVLDLVIYLYILLFFYTAFSKMITYSSFVKILSELPLIGWMHLFLASFIIVLEVLFGLLLIFPKTRIKGLWVSLFLMVCFTIYLGYHIMVRSKLPCSCGGVISGMTWPQHFLFNIAFILMAIIGLLVNYWLTKLKISTRGNR